MEGFPANTQIPGHRLSRSVLAALGLLLCLLAPLSAQDIPKKAQKYFSEAEYAIGLTDYATAREKLEAALKIFPEYTQARLYLADVHFQLGEFGPAAEHYDILRTGRDYPARTDFFLARALFELGRFDESLEAGERYLQSGPSEKSARDTRRLLANAAFSRSAVADPLPFEPVSLGPAVNSEHNEYLPALNADETTVIFTRLLNGQEDLYLTGLDRNGQWKPAKPLDEGPVNTGHNEGAHCLSANGELLLLTICNERNTRGSCDIYLSKKRKGAWDQPANIGPPVNSPSWDSQPTLTADGRRLYFVSNRKGGQGGMDIWYSDWAGESWGEPVNAGPVINTPYDEQTPVIHFDNETLYFSSDGHPGMGRQDIYVTRLRDGRWTEPVNLGYPINTNKAESGLIVTLDGSKAYFAAQRTEGLGGMDIYSFDVPTFARPNRVIYVRANIADSETGKPVEATYTVTDLATGEPVQQGLATEGDLLISLPAGRDYSLHIGREGYLFESLNFSLKDTVQRHAHVLNVAIEPVQAGYGAVLRNVFFATDSDELRPESAAELDILVDFLREHPGIRVEIAGHTDNVGAPAYNLELSQRRAESVVRYLTDRGIDPARLTARGYGETRPVAGNDSPEGRAQNRRTEFMVVE